MLYNSCIYLILSFFFCLRLSSAVAAVDSQRSKSTFRFFRYNALNTLHIISCIVSCWCFKVWLFGVLWLVHTRAVLMGRADGPWTWLGWIGHPWTPVDCCMLKCRYLKMNFFLLDLNNNLLIYTQLVSCHCTTSTTVDIFAENGFFVAVYFASYTCTVLLHDRPYRPRNGLCPSVCPSAERPCVRLSRKELLTRKQKGV